MDAYQVKNTAKYLNGGHLRVLKNLSVIKRCPPLGRNLMMLTWKNLCFAEFSTKFIEIQGWLLLTFFSSIIVQMSEKRVHQIDSKNEWLLLSVTFTAKLELVFVLLFENAFS